MFMSFYLTRFNVLLADVTSDQTHTAQSTYIAVWNKCTSLRV